jgi:lysophospholipase L1-like esterase
MPFDSPVSQKLISRFTAKDATTINDDAGRALGSGSGGIANDATVLQWYDSLDPSRYLVGTDGNGLDPARGFQYKAVGPLGTPAMYCNTAQTNIDGTGRSMIESANTLLPALVAAGSYTMVLLLHKLAGPEGSYPCFMTDDVGGPGKFNFLQFNGNFDRYDAGSTAVMPDGTTALAYTFASAGGNTGVESFYINEAAAPRSVRSGGTPAYNDNRKARFSGFGSGAANSLNGYFMEILFFQTALSNVEIAEVFAFFNSDNGTNFGTSAGPLTAGTLSASEVGKTSQTIASTSPIGGSGGNSYQLYKSQTSGSAASIAVPGNLVTGATSLTNGVSGLTSQTRYFYVLKTTDSSGTSVLSQVLEAPTHGNTTVKIGVITDSNGTVTPGGVTLVDAYGEALFNAFPNLDPVMLSYAVGGRQMRQLSTAATPNAQGQITSLVADMVASGVEFAHLMVGTNDSGTASPSDYALDLASVANAITAAGITVFIDQIVWRGGYESEVTAINEVIAGFPFTALARKGDATLYAETLNNSTRIDGLHLKAPGVLFAAQKWVESSGEYIHAQMSNGEFNPGFHSSIPGLLSLEAKYHAYSDTAAMTPATTDGAMVAAFQVGGINLLQAEEGRRPVLKKGTGIGGSDVLRFDGFADRLRDEGLSFGSDYTLIVVGQSRRRAAQNQGVFDVAGAYFYENQGSTPTVIKGGQFQSNFCVPNYPCVKMWSVRGNSFTNRIDDKTPFVQTGVTFEAGTSLTLADVGSNNCGALDVSHVIVHPSVGLDDSQLETLFQELSDYYGGFPVPLEAEKTLVVSDGNSYSSAGANAAVGSYIDNGSEYQIKGALSVGDLDIRCIGLGGTTTTGTSGNSLVERATYVDGLPAKLGTSLADSILLVGEGTNQTGAANFPAFQNYIEARVAAGWGQIVLVTPAASGFEASGNGVSGDVYTREFYDLCQSTTWPGNVIVADMRQGPIATWSPTYFGDYLHWNYAGHDAAAGLLIPSLTAAKAALVPGPNHFYNLDASIDRVPVGAGGSVAGIIDHAGGILSVANGMLQLAQTDAADYIFRGCYVPGSDASTDQSIAVRIPANPPTNFCFSALLRFRLLENGGRNSGYFAGFNENHAGSPQIYIYWTGSIAQQTILLPPTAANWYDRSKSYLFTFQVAGTLPTILTLTIAEELSESVQYTATFTDSSNDLGYPLQSAGYAGINTAGINGFGGGPFATNFIAVDLQTAPAALVVPSPILVSRTSTTNTLRIEPSGGTSPYSYQWHRKSKDFSYTPDNNTAISGATTQQITNSVAAGELWMYKCVVTDKSGIAKVVTSDFLMVETLRSNRGALPGVSARYDDLILLCIGDSLTTSGALATRQKQYLLGNGVSDIHVGNVGFQGVTFEDFLATSDGHGLQATGSINPDSGQTYASEYGGSIPGNNARAKLFTIYDALVATHPGRPVIISLMLGMNDQLQGRTLSASLAAAKDLIDALVARGATVLVNGITWAYTGHNGPSRANATSALQLRDELLALADGKNVFAGFTDYYYDLYKEGLTAPYFGSDFVHFLEAGYDVVAPVQGESILRQIIAPAAFIPIFQDDFNRPDGPVGNNWQGAANRYLVNNALRADTGTASPWNDGDIFRPVTENTLSQKVSVEIAAGAFTSGFYLVLRRRGNGTAILAGFITGGGTCHPVIQETSNGNLSGVLADATAYLPFDSTHAFRFTAEAEGAFPTVVSAVLEDVTAGTSTSCSFSFTGGSYPAFQVPGGTGLFAYGTQLFDSYEVSASSAPATTYYLSGPSIGAVGVASPPFAVSPDGSFTGTVTPAATGGSFSPASLTWNGEATAKVFTYTPASPGSHTISLSNSGGLTNPAPQIFAAPADSTAPALLSATIPAAGHKFQLVFSEPVQGLNPDQFSTSGVTFSNAQGSGTNWNLGTSSIYKGGNKMLTYSGTGTTDLAGNALAPFANFVVANNSTLTAPVSPGKVPVRVTYEFNGIPVPDATFTFRLVGLSDAFFIGVALQDLSQALTTTVGDDIVELLKPSGDGFWICECPNGENFALDLSGVEFNGEPVELKDVRA